MGILSIEDTDCNVEMTSKPKERQFQVVAVPGIFTRGRWQCCDYRDADPIPEEKVLSFSDKVDKTAPSTISVVMESQFTSTLDLPHATDTLTHTVSEPQLPIDTTPVVPASTPAPVAEPTVLPTTKESSTIVVTSIAPAAVTPVRGTPTSATISAAIDPAIATIHIPIVPTSLAILSETETVGPSPSALSPPMTQVASTTTTISLAGSVSPQQAGPSTTALTSTFVSPTPTIGPTSVIAQPSRQVLTRETSAPQGAPSPVLSRQTSLASFPDSTIASIPVLSPIDSVLEDSTAVGNAPGGPNVVAIDNKIEQAMDLVKTHLTFAVREEVEILRSTIVELEAKVAQLEGQNQLLRQFAPAEVVANLAYLVQNLQKQKEAQAQAQAQAQQTSTAQTPASFQPAPTSVQPVSAQPTQPMIIQQQPAVPPIPATSKPDTTQTDGQYVNSPSC